MNHCRQQINRILTFSVLLSLLLLNGLVYPQIASHSLHHAQHSSAMHQSPLCFWVCTAGQMETSSTWHLDQTFTRIGDIALSQPTDYQRIPCHFCFTRGPPSLPITLT